MTKTQSITRSPLFARSLQNDRAAAYPSRTEAQAFLDRQAVTEDALLNLFDQFDDFDDMVRECIPVLPEPKLAEVPAARQERTPTNRSQSGRATAGKRARVAKGKASGHAAGHSRR